VRSLFQHLLDATLYNGLPDAKHFGIRAVHANLQRHPLRRHHFSPKGRISCSNTHALRGC